MLKIRCIRKCIYKGKVFKPGQITDIDGSFSKDCFTYLNRPPVELSLPKCSGSVTLLGDGPSLQYALDNPEKIKTPVAAVNRVGVKWPLKLDYWISLHTYWLAFANSWRKKTGHTMDGLRFISNRVPLKPDVIRSPDHFKSGGGSGLYAAETLELMGFNHIHIIGIDLTGRYEWFRPAWKPENFKIKITAHCGFLKELFEKENE